MIRASLIFLLIVTIRFESSAQNESDSLRIVDYHVHVFSEVLMKNLREQGHDLKKNGFRMLGPDNTFGDIDLILKRNSNSKMLLISGGYAYKSKIDTTEIHELKIVRKENDFLSRIVSKYPEKLVGFYGLNPLKDYLIPEIKRCKEKLKLHGLKLHFQGCKVDIRKPEHLNKIKILFKYLSKEKIPVIIHNNASDNDTGTEYANIFIESILRETDSMRIIFAHSGGGGWFTKFTKDVLTSFKEYFQNDEASSKHKIYFELSGAVWDKDGGYPGLLPYGELSNLIREIGVEKFLFGSDYPYQNVEIYLRALRRKLPLNKVELRKIMENNLIEELKR